MKPTLSMFVDRLEKMLKRCDQDTIKSKCPGAPRYDGTVQANYLLGVDDEWCPLCKNFMDIPGDHFCPCQIYTDNTYDVAVDRVKEYRASERKGTL